MRILLEKIIQKAVKINANSKKEARAKVRNATIKSITEV
jgi:hypothetical protein